MRGEITMWIEIPVEVTFEYDEGEKQTRDYPGSPPEIEFLSFDSKKTLDDIDSEIREDPTLNAICFNKIFERRSDI